MVIFSFVTRSIIGCLLFPLFSAPLFCFYSFIIFLLMSLNSSPSWVQSRSTQPCRLCPLCSRCAAFPTSMEASWWDPSLRYATTRGWLEGSWPTALESLLTGDRARKLWKEKFAAQHYYPSVNILPPLSLLFLLYTFYFLLVLYQL